MRLLRAALILVAAALSVLPGCRKVESIEQYTVDHPDREALELRVAILPHKDDVFFVRLSGPEVLIKKQGPAFEAFVKSIKFEDKKDQPPIVVLEPKGWEKGPPMPGRVASYRIEADDLEVKVTQFPRDKFALLMNIQRWQKEMNLPLANNVAEAEKFTQEAKIGEQSVTWVTMNGLVMPKYTAPPPVAAAVPAPRKRPPMPRAAETPFKYQTPMEWISKPPRDEFTAVLFEVANKDQTANVTLTSLKGAGGGMASNLRRWRAQIDLPEVPEAELIQSASPMKVAGTDAFYVDLANPKGPPAKNRILAVILPLGQETWFIRMSGPHDWVGQNKNAFETFVKSFQLDAR